MSVPLPSAMSKLTESGPFLRKVFLGVDNMFFASSEEWDTPSPPVKNDLCLFSLQRSLRPRRFHYCPINDSTTGITVCARAGKNVGLFVHQNGGNCYRTFVDTMYKQSGKSIVFIYFPLMASEKLLEVRIRKIRGSQESPRIRCYPYVIIRGYHVPEMLTLTDTNKPLQMLCIRTFRRI
jgi:hypothetical protein